MAHSADSNRREFLSGRAAQKALRAQVDGVIDAVLDDDGTRISPQGQETIRLETRAMACQWAVVMNPGPPRQVMSASDSLDFIHAAEDLLTIYRDDSNVARLNQHGSDSPQSVTAELFSFLQRCRNLWAETAGTFEPSMGALIQLWRRARLAGKIPEQVEVDEALARTGMQHIHFDVQQETVFFDVPGLILDFGAVGKGYACDLAASHLRSEGIQDFIVHGGHSSLYGQGDHGGHVGWPVGIKNPLLTDRRYATLLLRNQGMSTSGSNVQYFRYRGVRYGHLLDPRNGWPAHELLSVTVVAPDAMIAEALSTAFYVMGLDKAVRYCDDHPDVGAILIPPPVHGRRLEPIVRNVPQDQLFFEPPSEGKPR